MPRIGFFEKQEPLEIKTEKGSEMICQCGLAKTFPFCDGHHLKTKNEEPTKVYQYIDDKQTVIGEIHGHDHGDGCGCGDDKEGGCCKDDKEGDHECGCGHEH